MRVDDFSAGLYQLWDGDPQTADWPRDRRFAELRAAISGQAVENTLAVLNFAGHHLEPGEVYLEAGALRGLSICAAALDNADGLFVTVDNFSQFGGPVDECRANIETWTAGNVELVDSSVWDYIPRISAPVGVWFYDARHEWWDQWRALEMLKPFLADEALVLVDDASWREVGTANTAFVSAHPRFQFVARFRAARDSDPRWWNGLDVIAYRRSLPAADQRLLRRARRRPLVMYGMCWRAFAVTRHHVRHLPARARRAVGRLARHWR